MPEVFEKSPGICGPILEFIQRVGHNPIDSQPELATIYMVDTASTHTTSSTSLPLDT